MASQNLGRVGLVLKGTWSSTTQYEKLDVVAYDGNSWAAKRSNKNVTPNTTNTDDWQLMANNADVVSTVQGYKNDAEAAATSAAASALDAAKYNLDALANEANNFDATAKYSAGEYVIYDDETHKYLYRFTANHAAGAWTGADAVKIAICDDLGILDGSVAYMRDMTGIETNVTFAITLTDGKFIVSNTGAESSANADYSRSAFVDVTGYDTVRITMPMVTISSTNMGLAFYAADETYISGYRVEYGQLAAGFLTAEYPVPSNARYFRTSWFSSGGDFSTLYGNFACTLVKKPNKKGRYIPTWNAGGLAPSTGLPSPNSKRIYSDWRHINSGDGIISCTAGYTFGVFCKNAIGSYLGWFNQRTALFSVSAITGYTAIDTQWLIAHGVDQIAIVMISSNDISPSAGVNVTWTCDQGAADATTALEQISSADGRIDALYRDIAAVETNPATSAHSAGVYIIWDGQLYEVTNEIAAGETLTVGTNIEPRMLGDMLTDIKLFNAISIFDSVDSLENGDYVLRAQKTTNGKRLYWEPVE